MSIIIAFLPLTLLILLALTTKRMAEAMTASTLLAMVLVHKTDFFSGMIADLYGTLNDSSFQFVLILMVLFGGVIELFQRSGGLMGFGNLISKHASGKHKPLILAWIMSAIMFADEYLNTITVGFSMRNVTDRNNIPREHLAFQTHSMACCLCVVVPFTSWIGFTLGLIEKYDLYFIDYVKAVPMMLYPLLLIILCLLLALGVAPKVGVLKNSYERVNAGGKPYLEETDNNSLVDINTAESEVSSAYNALIPIVGLIAGVLIFDNDLTHGLFICLALQFVLYVILGKMKISDFFEAFFVGVKSMTTLTLILFMGFTLSTANKELGFFDIVISGVSDTIPAFILPAIAFLITGFCVFAIGGCWIVMLITIPVFVPMALATGINPSLVLAAVMSGVTMGYGLCFYGDTVFMTSMGTGVSNITIIKSALPYGIMLIAVSTIGFIGLGLFMTL